MESDRFDQFTRSMNAGRSRRTVSSLLGVLALTPLLGRSQAEAKKKGKGKKKKKKGTPSPPPPATLDAPPPPPPPSCPSGQDLCGGICRPSCPSVRVRNPQTCGCCRPSGVREVTCGPVDREPCCSGLACGPLGPDGGTACPGRQINDACSFSAQCDNGLICNANLVCA